MSSMEACHLCCANCGIAGLDNVKLEECNDCDLVRYCGDQCREEHRELHKEECNKRKMELHDRKLFTQPDETHLGECPLCFLPLPIDKSKSGFWSCCSSVICRGCVHANYYKSNGDYRCPFCREPHPRGEICKEENDKRLMKRIKANDPAAMNQMGGQCCIEGDYNGAFEYYTKAAELSDADAHNRLGFMYWKGQGVEKDEEKAVYHWEKAAIGGHPEARHGLALIEEENGNIERAVKHYIIAASLGFEMSMKKLWSHYSAGNITKEDLDGTLRAHQAAILAMKSAQRDIAD